MDIKSYFNKMADNWDEDILPIDEIRRCIVFLSGIKEHTHILDVACGTGAMFTALQEKNSEHVTAVDISEKMVEIANNKVKDNPLFDVRCGDFFEIEDEKYDCIMIYNAYPHFIDKEKLVAKVSQLLTPDGRFVVAHGAGKEIINLHHSNVPKEITSHLLSAEEESKYWKKYFNIDILIDIQEFYMFSGTLAL